MANKKLLALALIAVLSLSSCAAGVTETAGITTNEKTSISGMTADETADYYLSLLTSFDKKTSYDSEAARIMLNGDDADIRGDGASFEGGRLSITAGGDYVITGVLTNGSVYVNAPDEKVHLVFCGVSITSSGEAALLVESADKVSLTLMSGTENSLTDTVVTVGGGEHKACVYARDDLTVNGSGTLTVTGTAKNAITCKNDLRLIGASVTVKALNNGIKADDSMIISGCTLHVTAGKDAVKVSDDSGENDEGYIYISGGEYTLIAGDDGIQADALAVIASGTVTTHAEGKAVNAPTKEIADGCLIKK